MSPNVPGSEWHARTLRAWQLAMLRLAVTLDNADRLAVMAIAGEIDRLAPEHGKPAFGFFRRTSAELCAAILQPNEHTSIVLRQYLARMEDDRLKRAFAAAMESDQPKASLVGKPIKRDNGLWKGNCLTEQLLAPGPAQATRNCSTWSSGAARGRAAPGVLFAPFRSGTAHIVTMRLIRPARPVPGGTEKRHDGGDDFAQERNQSGCGERELRHVTPHARQKWNRKRRAGWPDFLLALGRPGFGHDPIIMRAVEANTAKLEFALHAAQFCVGDRLDHGSEIAGDAPQRLARVNARAFLASGRTGNRRPIGSGLSDTRDNRRCRADP